MESFRCPVYADVRRWYVVGVEQCANPECSKPRRKGGSAPVLYCTRECGRRARYLEWRERLHADREVRYCAWEGCDVELGKRRLKTWCEAHKYAHGLELKRQKYREQRGICGNRSASKSQAAHGHIFGEELTCHCGEAWSPTPTNPCPMIDLDIGQRMREARNRPR